MGTKTLTQHVQECRAIARQLLPHTFPKVKFEVEQDILLLKNRAFVIDGHDVIVCMSLAEYPDHMLESLQIQSNCAPFLPFHLVCKIGRAFLGSHNLAYIEFLRQNRKVYCWTLRTRDEETLPPDVQSRPGAFEGFDFHVLLPGTVDLY